MQSNLEIIKLFASGAAFITQTNDERFFISCFVSGAKCYSCLHLKVVLKLFFVNNIKLLVDCESPISLAECADVANARLAALNIDGAKRQTAAAAVAHISTIQSYLFVVDLKLCSLTGKRDAKNRLDERRRNAHEHRFVRRLR